MQNPLTFRPDFIDPDHMDWEDNPASNAMSWVSTTFLPKWCQIENHWTSRLFNVVWAECGCCLFFRGIAIGGGIGLLSGLIVSRLF